MNNIENVTRVALDDGEEYQNVMKLFIGEKKNGLDSSTDKSRAVQVVEVSFEYLSDLNVVYLLCI